VGQPSSPSSRLGIGVQDQASRCPVRPLSASARLLCNYVEIDQPISIRPVVLMT
jgi:hypothetical protein